MFFIVLSGLLAIDKTGNTYEENFNSLLTNTADWELNVGSGSILFTSTHIKLMRGDGPANKFPYVRTNKSVVPSSGSFEISLAFNYLNTGNFGDGISITQRPPEYGTYLDSHNHKDHILFLIWQGSSGLEFYTTTCPAISPTCLNSLVQFHKIRQPDTQVHNVQLSYDDQGVYRFFLDTQLSPLFISATNQSRPVGFWLGHTEFTKSLDLWSSFQVDYIRINNLLSEKFKTLLIPGFGSSWDYDAILTGTPGNDWQLPSWMTVYNNLIASLENAGNERDKDFFVFNYDWRKGLEDLGSDLAVYISSLESSGKISSDEKINLVGHSYGGLVARSFAQNNLERVNKIATLGSPHEGAAQSYLAWEGGQYSKTEWWQKVALELVLKLNQQQGESRVETIRRLVPSIKDLLPTENFLVDQSTQNEISVESMSQQNDFLSSLNLRISTINSIAEVISGDNRPTPEKILVTSRTWLDQILNRWEDGVPVEIIETTAGDGTVTKQSATSLFNDKTILDNNHGELVYSSAGIEKVLEILGLDQSAAATTESPLETDRVLVALLRSPGRISIKDEIGNTLGFGQAGSIPNGVYLPEEKILIIPNFSDGDFTITVDGNNESGGYKLLVGNLSGEEPLWQEFSARVTEEDIDQYGLEVTETSLDLLPFETGPDILEYLEDLLSAIADRVANWSGPEKVRAQLLLEMISDDFEKIQETSDDTFKRISFNRLQANTFGIKDLTIRLHDMETESLTDSLLTALGTWHEVEVVEDTNQSLADFERDLGYFDDLADQIKQQMTENSNFVSPQDVQHFLNWQTLFPEAVRLSDTNLESSIYNLRGAAQRLYKLEDKFVQ